MKLVDLRDVIERSNADDWERLDHMGYRPRWSVTVSGDEVVVDLDAHWALLTLRDDIDVQIAYGINADFAGSGSSPRPRNFEWAKDFLHPVPNVVVVHSLYRGNIVDECWVLSFDGAWLPFPEAAPTADGVRSQFSGRSLRMARLLHSIDYRVDIDEMDRLMRQSGLPVEP